MPLYEYECKKCGHHFEKLVSISAAKDKQTCPKCGDDKAEKQMSTFSTRSSGTAPGGSKGGGGFT